MSDPRTVPASRTVSLGPKATYWRALGPIGFCTALAAFSVSVIVYDFVARGYQSAENEFGAWILLAVFGLGALAFVPSAMAARRGGILVVDALGVRLVDGHANRLVPWADMAQVDSGPRRIWLGKTSGVGDAIRIRGSKELLPIEVDEINYRVDHTAFQEATTLIVATARAHGAAVSSLSKEDW